MLFKMHAINLKVLLIFIATLLFFLVAPAYAVHSLKVMGRNPFVKPPLESIEDLREMVRDRQIDLETGFAKVGQPELFETFIHQFPTVEIDTVDFQPGETLQWMLYRKNDEVRVLKDVIWDGAESFPAYQFHIDHDNQRYLFVVPLICGNLSLQYVTDIPPPPKAEIQPPPPAPPPNQAPQCQARISPERLFSGQTITVDASASTDPDGEITSMTCALIDSEGSTAVENTVDQPPFEQQLVIPKGGNYRIEVSVTDDDGAVSSSPGCEQNVVALSRGRFLADVGYFHQFDPANYLAGRIGYEYRLNERFSLIGMIGGFPKVSGDDGAGAFTADAFLNYRALERFFAGIGVGGWITDGDDDLDAEDSQVDFIANLGVRVLGQPETFNTSVFVEGRSAFDEFDDFGKYGRFGAGLRFQF
jgi:PKD domain